jgi:scyllo-inositol 2-dehydrogenase (NADP+)
LTIEDFEKIFKTAKEHKRFFSIFQNRRLDGDYLTCKKLFKENSLGKVKWIEVSISLTSR